MSIPPWVNLVFACEVVVGTLGSVALLLRKSWALRLFVISFFGVLSQSAYIWLASDHVAELGAPAILMPLIAISIGIGMIVLTLSAISKGWIRWLYR